LTGAVRDGRAPLFVGLAAVLVHLRALRNGYAFDDAAIVSHPLVQSVRTLPEALAAPWWYAGNRLYRPLSLLSIGVDRLIGHGAPWLPHAVNVALHGVIAVLVARLCLRLLPPFAAIAAALLFAVLPVHAEAVATVVGRAELLAALAIMLLLLRVTRDEQPGPRAYLWAALLSAAALAGKESGATAPALVLAAAWSWPAQRRNAVRWAAWAMVGTCALLAARVVVLGSLAGDLPHPFFRGMSAGTRVTVALALLPRMATMLFVPVPPAVEDVPSLAAALHPNLLGVAAGAGLVIAALLLAARHQRAPSALTLGACIAAAALVPTSNLLFAAGAVTGRTLYSPSIGAALMAGAVIAWLAATRARAAVPFAVTATCLWAALLTAREVTVWRDTPTVLATMAARHPDNYRAHELLAYAARDAGRDSLAVRHFGAAIERFPADPEMLTDAATVALRLRDTTRASAWLAVAVRSNPRADRARTRLYTIMRARGDSARAKALLLDGLRVHPDQRTWERLLDSGGRSAVR
jgi:hypothetical protein